MNAQLHRPLRDAQCSTHPTPSLLTLLVLGLILLSTTGCAQKLSGGWETVGVHPPEASFPFNRIEFDPAGKYTASGLYDAKGQMTDEVRTTTGEFQQSGGQLKILPHKGDAQAYRIRRRLDGRLEVTLDVPGQKQPLRAILAPSNQ